MHVVRLYYYQLGMYRSHQGLNAALLYVFMPDYDKNTDLLVINPITILLEISRRPQMTT